MPVAKKTAPKADDAVTTAKPPQQKQYPQFRNFDVSEVQVKLADIDQVKGAKVLLFAKEEAVRDVLNDGVGAMNWQSNHYACGNRIYCRIGIKEPHEDFMIFKDAVGVPDRSFEPEKTEDTDAFKRAARMWGVGDCFYRMPKIIVPYEWVDKTEDGKRAFSATYSVKEINYNAKGEVVHLVIAGRAGVPFQWDK